MKFMTRMSARCRGGVLVGVVGVVVWGLVVVGGASALSSCSLSVFSASSQPACWTPFNGGSPFNRWLPADPVLARNDGAVRAHMARYGWAFPGGRRGFVLQDRGSRPVYFARATDPVMRVHCLSAEGPKTCQGANGLSVNRARIHVPVGARSGSNWDAHLTVVETATGQEYDFWHARVAGRTVVAGTGAVQNVYRNAGTRSGAADAASFALTAGLLRPSELASGHIDHALALNIPCTSAHGANVGFVWPAAGGWGQPCGQFWNESRVGAPNIGQLFRLNMTDAQIAASGAPRWERTIMTALARYGAYAEDTSGYYHESTMSILQQDPSSWTNLGKPDQWARVIRRLGGRNGQLSSRVSIPVNRLEIVNPCVPRGTC